MVLSVWDNLGPYNVGVKLSRSCVSRYSFLIGGPEKDRFMIVYSVYRYNSPPGLVTGWLRERVGY